MLAGTRFVVSAYECRELSDILYVVDKKGRFTAQPMAEPPVVDRLAAVSDGLTPPQRVA